MSAEIELLRASGKREISSVASGGNRDMREPTRSDSTRPCTCSTLAISETPRVWRTRLLSDHDYLVVTSQLRSIGIPAVTLPGRRRVGDCAGPRLGRSVAWDMVWNWFSRNSLQHRQVQDSREIVSEKRGTWVLQDILGARELFGYFCGT